MAGTYKYFYKKKLIVKYFIMFLYLGMLHILFLFGLITRYQVPTYLFVILDIQKYKVFIKSVYTVTFNS